MKSPFLTLVILLFGLVGCSTAGPRNQPPRILAIGDSLMAWHSSSRRSIPHALSAELDEPVVNRSVSGARVIYGLPISGALGMNIGKQFIPGDWDWVVVNGGGNDLWFGCGCHRCERKLNRLISPDGRSGEIPRLVARVRATGAKVVYLGYLRSPGVGSLIEHCRDEGDELERRIALLANRVGGVHFLSLARLVPHGDRSYHSFDMIHPSLKASAAIGRSVARIISAEASGRAHAPRVHQAMPN